LQAPLNFIRDKVSNQALPTLLILAFSILMIHKMKHSIHEVYGVFFLAAATLSLFFNQLGLTLIYIKRKITNAT
jgi:hypothetical protein